MPGYRGFTTFCNFRERSRARDPTSLIESLVETQSFLATDARDKVFALLGLVYDGAVFVPTPNYSLSLQDSQISITRAVILTTGVLDIIIIKGLSHSKRSKMFTDAQTVNPSQASGRSLVSDENLKNRIPSWCPQWLATMDSTARFEAEYVGLRGPSQKFDAAGGTRFIYRQDPRQKTMLLVEAILFDQVKNLTTGTPKCKPRQPRSPYAYYDSGIRLALHRTLFTGSIFRCEDDSKLPDKALTRGLNLFAHKNVHKHERDECTNSSLTEWLEHNMSLEFEGQSLRQRSYTFLSYVRTPIFWIAFLLVVAGILFLSIPGSRKVLSHNKDLGSECSGLYVDLVSIVFVIASIFVGLVVFGAVIVVIGIATTSSQARQMILDRIDSCLAKSHMRLISTHKGYIGLAHAQSTDGDYIVILKGCTVPVILRPFLDGYEVVGMSYIQGIMKGEAKMRGVFWQTIKLY
jgi:hypothetical protein